MPVSMLSICIPIYNYDIFPLVHCLRREAIALNLDYEIIALDDASELSFQQLHRDLKQLENVRYIELEQNIGRAAIRNRLAELAQYEQLLFMDCDTMPEYDDFLARYLEQLSSHKLLYGGRSYAPENPIDSDFHFHWHYGRSREVRSFEQRQAAAYRSFMTNNFVIPKQIMLAHPFDEQLTQYGHEDTLFGRVLYEQQIPIVHLDNPMRHIGLDSNSAFISKSKLAIDNLLWLNDRYDLADIKLLRYFKKLKSFGLISWAAWWFKRNEKRLEKQFCSKAFPSLRQFDLYKLGYICLAYQQKHYEKLSE